MGKKGVQNEQDSKDPDLGKPIINQESVNRAEAEEARRRREMDQDK